MDKKANNYYYRGIVFNMKINLPCVVIAPNKKKIHKLLYWVAREDPLLCGLFPYSQTSLNTDTSLLRAVCFVSGERKPLHFL